MITVLVLNLDLSTKAVLIYDDEDLAVAHVVAMAKTDGVTLDYAPGARDYGHFLTASGDVAALLVPGDRSVREGCSEPC